MIFVQCRCGGRGLGTHTRHSEMLSSDFFCGGANITPTTIVSLEVCAGSSGSQQRPWWRGHPWVEGDWDLARYGVA